MTVRLLPITLGSLLCAWAIQGQTPRNLVRNSDLERAFLGGGPADGWHTGPATLGVESGIARGAGLDGGTAHRLAVADGAELTWYVCGQTVSGLVPGGRYVVSAYVRTEDVRDGHGAYIGANYFDSQGERITWTDSVQHLTGTNDWTRIEQPFSVPMGTVRTEVSLVLHGRGTALFDRVQVEAGEEAAPWESRELGGVSLPEQRTGQVAIFRDDLPATGTASDPEYLRSLVEAAGYGCTFLAAEQLADPAVLAHGALDVVVLPYGASFPAAAADSLQSFCREGGSLMAFGGYPFDRLLARQDGAWVDAAELRPDETKLRVVLDLSGGPAGWVVAGRGVPPRPAEAAPGREGQCLKVATESLAGWLTAASPAVEGLPADSRATAFYARADQDDVVLTFEWDERDGSRWRSRVQLTRDWKLYATSLADLEYWPDNPSQGRGGPDDRFHPENAARFLVGLTGEFLPEGRPYTAYVDRVMVGPDALPAYRNVRLNSHYGRINMATFLEPPPTAISICDASAPLTDVAYLAASPGQTLLPADWRLDGTASGYSATGQTAQGNAGAPLKARWVPVADAVDRYGRLRGTAFAVMHNFAGEYPGSSWAYSGISDRDLFTPGDAAGAALFRSVLDRLIRGAYLFEGGTTERCVRPGDTAAPTVHVGNLAREPRGFTVRLRVLRDQQPVAEHVQTLTVPARSSQQVTFEWRVPADLGPGLVVLRWELAAADGTRDRLEAGLVVWGEEQLASGPRLRYSDCYFSRGKGPEFLLGSQVYWGNVTVTGTDPLRWDRQFATMADNGLAVARSFMAPPGGNTEAGWRGRDALVQLAQAHGISLFYAGVSWPTTDPAKVAARAQVARQAAERYRAAPGWFIDVVNEPAMRVGAGATDSPEFQRYLEARYGSWEGLRAAWGDELTEASFADIEVAPMRGGWASVRAVDTSRFMSWKMRVWATETAAAAKAADPERLVSVGYLQGFGDATTMWDPIEGSYDLDFANRHYYGDPMQYAPELKQVDLRVLGKAPSTGEFGNTSHPGLRAHFVYAPEEEVNWRYAYVVHSCFGLGGAFVANWHFQDPIEDIFPCGVLLADGAPRPRFHTFRNLGVLFRQIRPRYEPPQVLFVIPTSHRFGNSKAAVEAAMNRCLQALISLHVEFGTVPEEFIGKLPPSAKALIWPVPFCPDDDTVAQVLRFVRAGGALYLSGDLSYDPLRRRTRTERLTELCGVEFVRERYPDIQYAPAPGAEVAVESPSALTEALRETAATGPCVEVRPLAAEVLARAAEVPVATLARIGAGTVLYSADPVELHTVPRALLAAFLATVGVTRHALEPDLEDLHSHRVPGEGGGVAQVLFNLSGDRQTVTISDLPAPLRMTLAPKWGGAAIFDGAGNLVALEALSATVDGRPVLEGEAAAGLVALQGRDVRSAQGLLLLPSGPGEVRLPGHREAGLWAGVGEVRDGRWVEYERLPLERGRLALDSTQARSWIVLGAEGNLAELGERVAREHL